jgi:hypothetical protein
LPDATLTNAITEPTAALIQAVLRAVADKAHKFTELEAIALQNSIELETVVRSSEARVQAAKTTAENALKDTEELRRKLQEEGTLRLLSSPSDCVSSR